MSELKTLEAQLAEAMDRIGRAAEAFEQAPPAGNAQEIEQLKADLEAERNANAEMEERVDALKERQEATLSRLEGMLSKQREAMADLDSELQRLREVNSQLEKNNSALREACQTGQVDAALINQAMLSELESMRAQRAAEQSEVRAAMSAIEPLLLSNGEDV